ncbi:hypothetical protein TUM3794_20150 [Shewanella colwelliana]|uniref:YbjN domain-containing protein n=1 Tax=Shewanella colwelliana TaxID=23 RepID=A0ABQ4P0N2_SHECO|nr:hypothetical protein [Shewanella colwelliana]GIU40955.1 hypothetical protein TUM3794_20150 [Shewanella colwelliana]
MNDKDDLIESVVKQQTEEHSVQSNEIIEAIGLKELAELLNEFSFCNSPILVDDDDTCFRITLGQTHVLFFSQGDWRERTAYVGMLISINRAFDEAFMSEFNQKTIVGRLYTANKEAGVTIFRGDVHLAGGVTKKHIYKKIKAFIDCYNAFNVSNTSH